MNGAPSVNTIGATAEPAATSAAGSGATAKQIRGSSLLLAGRVIALLLNFAAQVLMVRYLSKDDYGTFAYALSIVTITQGLVAFGLPDTVSRYVPIHRERREYGLMFGVIIVVVGLILALSAAVTGLAVLRPDWIAGLLAADPQTTALIVMLIFLVPGDALNLVLNSLFASFAKPSAIFWRKSVLIPGLRLLAVGAVIALGGGVLGFGFGLPFASMVGLLLYAFYFVRLLHREGYFARLKGDRLTLPVREVLGFALPLLSSTVVWHAIDSSNVLLLGILGTAADVAAYQAVVPLARINQVVGATFATLYIPIAARLFARDDRAGLTELYWQTAVWMALVCFPIFTMTFAFARPMTALVYGERYLDSAPILALLALGYFFQTAIGFNALTLRVHKRLGFLMLTDLAAVVLQVGLSILLFPRLGAVGAAVATLTTLVVHALLIQGGLRRYGVTGAASGGHLRIYAATAGAGLLLAAAGWLLPAEQLAGWRLPAVVILAGVTACLATLGLLRIGRDVIKIDQLFPELTRLPVISTLLRLSGVAQSTREPR
jgi:O-antigen/teichoic acid export membrane protein